MEPERIWLIIEKILIDNQEQYEDFFDQKVIESDPFVKNLWKECFSTFLELNRYDGKNEVFLQEIGIKIEKFLREAPIEKQRIWAFSCFTHCRSTAQHRIHEHNPFELLPSRG